MVSNKIVMNPMMAQKEIDMILKYIDSSHNMLEYGSGGSTSYFSNYVNHYYSIEHQYEWAQKVQQSISSATFSNNVTYNIIDPSSGPVFDIKPGPPALFKYKTGKNVKYDNSPHDWESLHKSDYYRELQEYISFPATHNILFDSVLIDGRARPECAKFIYDFLADDGVIFIHDYFPRPRYACVTDRYIMIDSVHDTSQTLAVFKKIAQ